MKICDKFKQKTVCSFEIFPPKVTTPIETIYKTLEELSKLNPDYISVTYGAGGSENRFTEKLCGVIKKEYGIEPLAHLTALYQTEEGLKGVIEELESGGIENVLALRGDRIPDRQPTGLFRYAVDLVRYLKTKTHFNLVGAGYPEGHFEAESYQKDIEHLKEKVDAGVTHINTQLFFDNEDFFRYIDICRKNNINVPIQAGIMPIVKRTQIDRTIALSGAKVPKNLANIFAKYADNPEALQSAGIAYATQQITELLSQNVDGIHLYVMNRADIAKELVDNVKTLF